MGGDHQGTLDLGKGQHATSLRCARGITTLARMVGDVALGTFDLSDPEFWIAPRDYRHSAFRALRGSRRARLLRRVGVREQSAPTGSRLLGSDPVRRHLARRAATRSCSAAAEGVNIGDMPQEMNEFFGSMIAMDDPSTSACAPSSPRGSRRSRSARSRGTCAPRPRRSSTACSSSSPTASATSSSRSPHRSPCRSSAR